MVDWRVKEQVDIEESGDDRPYSVTATMGNQPHLEFKHRNGDIGFVIMIEINHGVPAVRIDPDGLDTVLNIHKGQGGLVLTPGSFIGHFQRAEQDRLTYGCSEALVIR